MALSSPPRYGKLSVRHWGLPILSLGFHPQTNGQTEKANCVMNNPASWSQYLPWVKYVPASSLTSAAAGMSLFEASLGNQLPMFPSQEQKLSVPSIQYHLHWCHGVWRKTQAVLSRNVIATWPTTRPPILVIDLAKRCGYPPKTVLYKCSRS